MRLAGEQKLGYYPTPPQVIDFIRSKLRMEGNPDRYNILDPCCGTGEFVDSFPGASTYGNELDEGRYFKSKMRVGTVINGDAINELAISREAFSAVWLNPPYTYIQMPDGKSVRAELAFLKKAISYLTPQGVLIYIIPSNQITQVAKVLSYYFKEIKMYLFPEDNDPYKQLVIIAKRQTGSDYQTENSLIRSVYQYGEFEEIHRIGTEQAENDGVCYDLPLPAKPVKIFRSIKVNYEELEDLVKKNGSDFSTFYERKERGKIKCPMPLRQGHMAILLAAGYLDGEFRKNGKWYVVKGTAKKKVYEIEEEETVRRIDKIYVELIAWDMNQGKLIEIN